MAALASLPASLLQHAAVRPHEPWLFFAEGWDWRWRSWSEAAAQAARWSAELRALPAGTVAAYAGAPALRAWILDLAIQGAGLVAMPVQEVREAPADGTVWVEVEGGAVGEAAPGIATVRLAAEAPPAPRGAGSGGPIAFSGERPAGGVALAQASGPILWSQADLARRAAEIAAVLPASSEKREIVVCGRPLADPSARGFAAWATVAGAAVVLEPDPASLVATAVWARPTLFLGSAAEIVPLRAAVERADRGLFRRRRALPLSRLHTLLLAGPDPLPDAELAYWHGRGVRVTALPHMV